jgi:hypothetical protein
MTEAVLAGEQIKEFSFVPAAAVPAALTTVFARFAKNFFMSDGPGDARNGNREHEEFDELQAQRRHQIRV